MIPYNPLNPQKPEKRREREREEEGEREESVEGGNTYTHSKWYMRESKSHPLLTAVPSPRIQSPLKMASSSSR